MINNFTEIIFNEKGLIPVIVQDYLSNEVLMLAYMNKEALDKTLSTGKMHYYSRSRQKLWLKGETSGHYQYLKFFSIDCDFDTLLAKVEQVKAACHTGNYSCFFREFNNEGNTKEKKKVISSIDEKYNDNVKILLELYDLIAYRREHRIEGSYTNYLFDKGLDKILKKVGEETAEVIIAAKNGSKEEITYEVADLFYHLCVLLVEKDVKLNEIFTELASRNKEKRK